jgi:hypothetical protein
MVTDDVTMVDSRRTRFAVAAGPVLFVFLQAHHDRGTVFDSWFSFEGRLTIRSIERPGQPRKAGTH